MNENIKKVVGRISIDEAFAEKMRQCKSPREAYEVALTVADGFTLEEFQDVMTKIHNAASESGEDELTEEDIKQVAGGLTEGEAWDVAGGVTGLALIAFGSAAL